MNWRVPGWFSELPEATIDRLGRYHRELLKFTSRVNLISRGTEADADEVHVADAVLAARLLPASNETIYDVGSGNGVPGLILAIFSPAREIVLVESDLRKAEFLKHVAHELTLKNVRVLAQRAESLPTDVIRAVISRGFASVARTCTCLGPAVSSDGVIFHLKGAKWRDEAADLPRGWDLNELGTYTLPASGVERIVLASRRT